MISLTYIFHDCFHFRAQNAGRWLNIIFDYWKDENGENNPDPKFLERLNPEEPIYVLVSHFHKDHFNPVIFSWGARFRNIHFIISRDVARHARHILNPDSIYKGYKPAVDSVTVLRKGELYEDGNIRIDCFGSTDIGNSYAVTTAAGVRIFHAGDLNFWGWRDESTQEEIDAAGKAFRTEISAISGLYKGFDYAMFPVDSRIGTGYWEGAKIFGEIFEVRRFFPMHFELGETETEIEKRRKDALRFELYSSGTGEYIPLCLSGTSFLLND